MDVILASASAGPNRMRSPGDFNSRIWDLDWPQELMICTVGA
jgi:hypothetical protein